MKNPVNRIALFISQAIFEQGQLVCGQGHSYDASGRSPVML